MPRSRLIRILCMLVCLLAAAAMAENLFASPRTDDNPNGSVASPLLEEAFRLLYSLRFEDARAKIAEEIRTRPDDPLGHSALAASYLFEEFYRQGVLTSEFFLDDKRFLNGIEGKPDPKRRDAFLGSNLRAQQLAAMRLRQNPKDANALLVMALGSGMQADYLALLEKKQMASLRYIRESDDRAKELLAVKPDEFDAYLALGASNYIVGSLPGYKRFFLWFGGIQGQKETGMAQLEKTASRGHYVRPFAKVLLALASLREKQPQRARKLFEELSEEFPQNPLFQKELAQMDARRKQAGAGTSSP